MQKVLVTGASVGIGRLTAIRFARSGAQIVINYNSSEDGAKETLRLVEEAGGKGHILKADVSCDKQAAELIKKAAEIMGGLDVLVNNAGVTKFIPFTDLDSVTSEDFSSLYKINVESIFFASRAAAKIMEQQKGGGCIINLASISGMVPRGSSIPYSVTKAAIIHLTQCLAQVMAPNVRVNSVSPGTIQNTRWNSTNQKYDKNAYQSQANDFPLKRLGEPEDIAGAIYFLASPEASYITGINLPVEGGIYVRK